MQRLLRATRPTNFATRTFSSSTRNMAAKHEWLVILPDQADSLDRRMKVRPDHLKNCQPAIENGLYKLGGAFFDKPVVQGETPSFAGSVILAEAATKEEVIEALKNDVYTKNEVWDWSKVQVHPFKSAFRIAT